MSIKSLPFLYRFYTIFISGSWVSLKSLPFLYHFYTNSHFGEGLLMPGPAQTDEPMGGEFGGCGQTSTAWALENQTVSTPFL